MKIMHEEVDYFARADRLFKIAMALYAIAFMIPVAWGAFVAFLYWTR
jgi:hypothetical protein